MALQVSTRGYSDDALARDSAEPFDWRTASPSDLVGNAVRRLAPHISPLGGAAAVACGVLAFVASGASVHSPAALMASISTVVCVGVAWRRDGRHRLPVAAIGLGSALWCAGSRSRPVWELARTGHHRSLRLGDVAALLAMTCFAVAIVAILKKPAHLAGRLRFVAEGLMLASSILFASWVSILPPAF